MDEKLFEMSISEHEQTQRIFRTAYFISKVQHPYTDMPKLIYLQVMNGIDLECILHSNVICTEIIDHIFFEMKKN
jgi:hypothetical protein